METGNKPWLEEEQAQPEQLEVAEKIPFRQAFALLPRVLMIEVLKRIGIAILAAFATLLMTIISKDWMYCAGFFLAALAAYLGLDIVWKFSCNKVMVARMLICKSTRSIRQRNKFHVILRDATIEDVAGVNVDDTIRYDIVVAHRDSGNMTVGTILDIYFAENAPNTVLAYEILGEKTK